MNNINPVNIDKSAEYNNKLQDTFKNKIDAKEENSSMFSNAFGDGPAVKVEISSRGAEMSEKVKNGEMPEGAIKQLERTPLTETQLKSVKGSGSGEEILAKMKEYDPKAYKEYEELREKRENGGKEQAKEEAMFITRWSMRDKLPQLSCWEDMDKRKNDSDELKKSSDKTKCESTTINTDRVDEEIEKLKRRKAEIEQKLKTSGAEEKDRLEVELHMIQAELAQKDNDTYRRQNAIVN
jgi:hypothetical protein